MNCKCALECEYKIINLEQHVCHPLLVLGCWRTDVTITDSRLTLILTTKTSIQPQCIYISRPPGDVVLPPVSTLCNGKMLHLSARAHCVASSLCKNHCTPPARIRITLWKSYKTCCIRKKKKIHTRPNSFCFYFRLTSKITQIP